MRATEAVEPDGLRWAEGRSRSGGAGPGADTPSAPHDQRTTGHLGAICPNGGKAAALVLLNAVDPGAQAVLILGQAGWHVTPKLWSAFL